MNCEVLIFYYEVESKINTFFFCIEIITNTETYIIHQNETIPLWITFLLHNIVTVSLNSSVPPSNERWNPCLVKNEPLHHCSSHFLVTGIMCAS